MNRQILKTLAAFNLVTIFVLAAGVGVAFAQAPGTVQAWGLNGWGQLGDGTIADRFTFVPPVQVSGLINATAIAGGAAHSVALLADGTVVTWGAGQLDDGSGLANVTAVAGGGDHSLVLF